MQQNEYYCWRCGGRMLLDGNNELVCLMCGEHIIITTAYEKLITAIAKQSRIDRKRQRTTQQEESK